MSIWTSQLISSFFIFFFCFMKKYLLPIVLLALGYMSATSAFAESVTFDNGTTWSCDQSFAPAPVRYWYNYTFHDSWNNPTSQNTYLNTFEIQYKNANYLSADGVFAWTDVLRTANFTVAPASSIVALTTNPNWGVTRKPSTRAVVSGYDFMIGYKIGYDKSNNYPDATDDIQHVECQPYYVTWCGDGIVDTEYETCDSGASNGSIGSCNATCTEVVPPTPTPGVCSTTLTGPQPSPITAGLCNVGSPV